MIKAILFDAYGTLFDEGKESVPLISQEIVEIHKLSISSADFFGQWKNIYLEIENDVFCRKRPFQTIRHMNLESLSLMFKRYSISDAPNRFVDKLFRLWSFPALFPEVRSVLTSLKGSYLIGIVSNADNYTLRSALTHTGIIANYVLSSEAARNYKPNPGIFKRSFDDLKLHSDQIVYVGNSANDVIGAKRAGTLMIHVNRKNELLNYNDCLPDYVLSTLEPIPEIVGMIAE